MMKPDPTKALTSPVLPTDAEAIAFLTCGGATSLRTAILTTVGNSLRINSVRLAVASSAVAGAAVQARAIARIASVRWSLLFFILLPCDLLYCGIDHSGHMTAV